MGSTQHNQLQERVSRLITELSGINARLSNITTRIEQIEDALTVEAEANTAHQTRPTRPPQKATR